MHTYTHWFDYSPAGLPLNIECTVNEVRAADGKDWEIDIDDITCAGERVEHENVLILVDGTAKPLAEVVADECYERVRLGEAA